MHKKYKWILLTTTIVDGHVKQSALNERRNNKKECHDWIGREKNIQNQ